MLKKLTEKLSWNGCNFVIPFLALAVLTGFICMIKYADYDLWWHLKLGESIFTDLKLPYQDTFSYTIAGRHQYIGEWLGDLTIFLVFNAGGFIGLNLLKASLLLVAFAFIYLRIRDMSDQSVKAGVATVLTILLVLFSIRFRLFMRPYLFSVSFFAAYLFLIDRWRSGRLSKGIYLLPLIMLVWVNMSMGAVFGVFALGVATALELINHRSARLMPVFFLTALASLASPETWRLYLLALDLTSDPYRTTIGEFQPITWGILFGSGFRYTICFQILAVGGFLYLALCRGWKNLFHVILFTVLLYETFRQIRLVEVFSIFAAPFFALALQHFFQWFAKVVPSRLAATGRHALAPAILILIPLTVFNNPIYSFGAGPKDGAFPEGALRFLDRNGVKGRMFNSFSFGGYITWNSNGRKVFFDSRYRRVYTPKEFGEYKAIIDSAPAWAAAERKYHFDYAILEYDLVSRRFPLHLASNPDWALVYWDNQSLVYLKRTPEHAALIAANEYRVARPSFLDLTYLKEYQEPGKLEQALAQLDREVAQNPDNQFVLLARVYLRYRMKARYMTQIREDLERTLEIRPDFAMKHSALAMILSAAGETDRARNEVRNALRLNPLDTGAIAQAKALGIDVEIPKGTIPGHP